MGAANAKMPAHGAAARPACAAACRCHRLARMVHEHPCFELTSAVTSNILTYRFLPVGWKSQFSPWSLGLQTTPLPPQGSNPLPPHLAQLNQRANAINTELHKILRDRGQSFVSRTTLESVFPGQETIVLRAVTRNPHTEPHHLADMLAEQACVGMRLYEQSAENGFAVGFS